MRSKKTIVYVLVCLLLATLFVSCGDDPQTDDLADSGADSDSDSDSDGDSDGDSDTDSDADGDTDSDSDSDGDAGGDGDADTDTDGDTDTNSDTDADSGTDGDSDVDSDSDIDTDTAFTLCNGPWAEQGESCSHDVGCGAGLLCDQSSRTCRPIQGLTLIDSFYPDGRVQNSDDDYSEGLDFAHDTLWQSVKYNLFWIDLEEQAVGAEYPTPSTYGEGLTWYGDVLYNVSYHNNNLYRSELIDGAFDFEVVGQMADATCTYGLDYHCDEMFATRCGKYMVDVYTAGTTDVKRSFTVKNLQGRLLADLEDVEIYQGQLWTSSFTAHRHRLFRVDMATGEALETYNIPDCRIIDGVAVDITSRTMYLSGKNCPILVYRVD
ncbi:MAG: glutaminyl-peptide cyclotransferase [Proteobacteria bacterium]|nr:glutaminyl-peptide cyclotransferase [Pseudomonadota bacterium]